MSLPNFTIKRADFFELISHAHSLIEKRAVMPILSKVLLEAGDKKLSVQATDQDNSLQSHVGAGVEREGRAVVDAQSLFDILKELADGDISVSGQGEQKIKIKQGASVFWLLSLKVQDFPAFPPFQMKDSFFLKPSVLRHLIEKTAYCSSVDETRYHLTGVFFEVVKAKGGHCFRFVATDGHRLGLAEHPCEKNFLEKGVIVSRKGVQEIKKLISQAGEKDVEVAIDPPRILFRSGSAVLSVKLVEGAYPNYQPLIPQESAVSLTVSAEEFGQALRRVSLLSSNRFKGVNFHIKEKKIQMEAENPDLGSAQDEVACVRKKGEDIKVRFNARYMLEALGSFEGGKAVVDFGGKEKPCVIYPEKKEKFHSLCVVMPMKM